MSTIIGVAAAGAGECDYIAMHTHLLHWCVVIRDIHSSISVGNWSSLEGDSIWW